MFHWSKMTSLLAAGVFGDSLGAFADGVLGEFTGQEQTYSCLDLSACDGGSLVVVGESWCLSSDPLEDVIHEAVHDGHGFAGDASVWVHLLQYFVDVDRVGFPPLPLLFPVSRTSGLRLSGGLLEPLLATPLAGMLNSELNVCANADQFLFIWEQGDWPTFTSKRHPVISLVDLQTLSVSF